MTTAIDTTTTIAAPPEAVWAALTDWSLAPRWMPGVTAMRGRLSAGAEVTFTVRGKERTATTERLDAPRALALLSRSGPVSAVYTYTLTPVVAGTELRLVADVGVRGPLALLAGVIRRSIAKEDGVQPERLRAVVEAVSRPAG
ncbi:SRPBCC family protein [uncultured Cellulomonas sp.]|uniref:SRPBCC family protein n=1 Tax=uncultured Cellulomonas sp. TaxID=189682 RepID=UPI0028E7DC9B|nr:SRPBCC family protein [uncultured Cellulomonas sp.]